MAGGKQIEKPIEMSLVGKSGSQKVKWEDEERKIGNESDERKNGEIGGIV